MAPSRCENGSTRPAAISPFRSSASSKSSGGAVAFGVAVLLSVVLLLQGVARSPVAMLVFSLAAGVVGVLARDRALSRQVREREARILAEFPTIADLLALSVSAGEGPVGALERVAASWLGNSTAHWSRRALAQP